MTRHLKIAWRVAFAVLLSAVLTPMPVGAHAEVLGSSPGSGETVGGSISRVDIVFAEVVTDAAIEVTGPDGAVPGEMVQAEGLVVAFELDEDLSANGDYKVVFEFDSIDDDFVELEFSFTYEVGAPEPLPVVVGATSSGSTGLSAVAIGLLAVSTVGLALLLAWRYRQLSKQR